MSPNNEIITCPVLDSIFRIHQRPLYFHTYCMRKITVGLWLLRLLRSPEHTFLFRAPSKSTCTTVEQLGGTNERRAKIG